MRRRHGDIVKFLIGDQVVRISPDSHPPIPIPIPPPEGGVEPGIPVGGGVDPEKEKLFRFNYMFHDLPAYKPDPDDLIKLGKAMTSTAASTPTSDTLAGYTYLGQFIDHDLTFNAVEDLTLNGQPVHVKSKRSPSLDLDSLYGLEPELVMQTNLGKLMYDKPKLIVGVTDKEPSSVPSTSFEYFHDLPRHDDSREAALIDPRNDENLAVAQTHLAFIKFHNAMVDHLSNGVPADELFEKARENVIRHYQRVILDDFLPTLLEPEVVKQMQNEGPTHFLLKPTDESFMPLEFAFAAFRMGHSLVTANYEWNRVFRSNRPQPQPALLEDLFVFSGNGSFANHRHLPSNWIIDWTRFFDFSGLNVVSNEPRSKAGVIDAMIEKRLAKLTPIPNHDETKSLAVRNLLRGLDVGLPAGQDVAKHLGYPVLEPQDFSDLPYFDKLHELGFDELTPLWLYILHEAKFQNGGKHLGFVGSRIVAETFITLIKASRITVLPPGTKWKTPQEETKFGMANLLAFVNDLSTHKDFLNPLG